LIGCGLPIEGPARRKTAGFFLSPEIMAAGDIEHGHGFGDSSALCVSLRPANVGVPVIAKGVAAERRITE
jgi:hypothetical protein